MFGNALSNENSRISWRMNDERNRLRENEYNQREREREAKRSRRNRNELKRSRDHEIVLASCEPTFSHAETEAHRRARIFGIFFFPSFLEKATESGVTRVPTIVALSRVLQDKPRRTRLSISFCLSSILSRAHEGAYTRCSCAFPRARTCHTLHTTFSRLVEKRTRTRIQRDGDGTRERERERKGDTERQLDECRVTGLCKKIASFHGFLLISIGEHQRPGTTSGDETSNTR